jgi:hypothetical protein
MGGRLSFRGEWMVGGVIVGLALALLTTSDARAFRTGEDLPELGKAGPVGFATRSPRFSLDAATLPAGIGLPEASHALRGALETWKRPSCTDISPSEAASGSRAGSGDGHNTISWVTNWVSTGREAHEVGTTDVQYLKTDGVWVIEEADIYLNAEHYDWSTFNAEGALDVQSVLAHEVGHALGRRPPARRRCATPGRRTTSP